RRSLEAGDTAEAVAGRARFHQAGYTQPFLDAITDIVRGAATVLDAGCGDGYYLGHLAERTGCKAYGVDLSVPAIDAAAKRYPHCHWLVANADRFLPYPDGAFDAVLSITARKNAPEFHRVLRDDGLLLVAVPAPDD